MPVLSWDGKRVVVYGSRDHKIRIWDMETREVISGPLEEHVDEVTSVPFSHNGKRLVSGSKDTTIPSRIWDHVGTGAIASGPFEGHTCVVLSVAFPQDGKRVVSSSHDGKHIASGSKDRMICIWDVETMKLDLLTLDGVYLPHPTLSISI